MVRYVQVTQWCMQGHPSMKLHRLSPVISTDVGARMLASENQSIAGTGLLPIFLVVQVDTGDAAGTVGVNKRGDR